MLSVRASLAAVSVVAPPGLARPIDRIELAGTTSVRSTVIWCSVHTHRSGRFAVVAELTPQASVESGLDAWLKSLDLVTAPRVLPPEVIPTACGEVESEPVLELLQRGRGTVAVQTMIVESDGIQGVLNDWNLPAFGPRELGVIDPQATLLAVLFEMKEGGGVSQPLRIRFDAALAPLPFVRSPGWEGIPVTSYLIAPGRAMPRSASVSAASMLDVTYRGVSHTTDYAEVLERFLLPFADVAWLSEASVGALDQWGFYAEDVAVPPLIDEYFHSARESSDIMIDPELCAAGARVRLAGTAAAVEPACAAADDLELALAGIPLIQARVTRYATLSHSASPAAIELEVEDAEPVSPVILASSFEGPSCGSVVNAPPPTSTPAEPGGEGEPEYVDPITPEYYYESEEATLNCAAPASSSSSDSCESDSSSEDDCEGDTSGSDDSYSGDSCSDDTSDDYEGDSCEGDDPPDGDDDSYSGDSCSDESTAAVRPMNVPTASIARSRPRRARLSVLTLALFSLLLGARRVERARRGSRVL
jgi:hypothetical protein